MIVPQQVGGHYHLWVQWLRWEPPGAGGKWEAFHSGPFQFSTTVGTWSPVVLTATIDGFLRIPFGPPQVWRFVWVWGTETTQPGQPAGWRYYGARANYEAPVGM